MDTISLANNVSRPEKQFLLTHKFINLKICDGSTVQKISNLADEICKSVFDRYTKNWLMLKKGHKKNAEDMAKHIRNMGTLRQCIYINTKALKFYGRRYEAIANLIETEVSEKISAANTSPHASYLQLAFNCSKHLLNLSLAEQNIIEKIHAIIKGFETVQWIIGPEVFKEISASSLRQKKELSQYLSEIRNARLEAEKLREPANNTDQLVQQIASEQQFTSFIGQAQSNLEETLNNNNILSKSNNSLT